MSLVAILVSPFPKRGVPVREIIMAFGSDCIKLTRKLPLGL